MTKTIKITSTQGENKLGDPIYNVLVQLPYFQCPIFGCQLRVRQVWKKSESFSRELPYRYEKLDA